MCVFCKIINNEIPSYKIYEDDDYLAFLDISQATIGHTLVIPKKHFTNIFELDDKTAKSIFSVVQKTAQTISQKLNIKNINILNNNGLLAGQTVEHFHVHIIPRYENDDLTIKFASHKLVNEEFITLQKKILN
jgi:histidine triad (HIT) family protein